MLIAKVLSTSDKDNVYEITLREYSSGKKMQCTCPHCMYRKKTCKHQKILKTAAKLNVIPAGYSITADGFEWLKLDPKAKTLSFEDIQKEIRNKRKPKQVPLPTMPETANDIFEALMRTGGMQ